MDEIKIISDALRCYGVEHQTFVAIEELSELQKELCKYLRDEGGSIDHLAEEVADVEIMLAQLKYAFCINSDVARHKRFKLGRLVMRIAAKRAAQGNERR